MTVAPSTRKRTISHCCIPKTGQRTAPADGNRKVTCKKHRHTHTHLCADFDAQSAGNGGTDLEPSYRSLQIIPKNTSSSELAELLVATICFAIFFVALLPFEARTALPCTACCLNSMGHHNSRELFLPAGTCGTRSRTLRTWRVAGGKGWSTAPEANSCTRRRRQTDLGADRRDRIAPKTCAMGDGPRGGALFAAWTIGGGTSGAAKDTVDGRTVRARIRWRRRSSFGSVGGAAFYTEKDWLGDVVVSCKAAAGCSRNSRRAGARRLAVGSRSRSGMRRGGAWTPRSWSLIRHLSAERHHKNTCVVLVQRWTMMACMCLCRKVRFPGLLMLLVRSLMKFDSHVMEDIGKIASSFLLEHIQQRAVQNDRGWASATDHGGHFAEASALIQKGIDEVIQPFPKKRCTASRSRHGGCLP